MKYKKSIYLFSSSVLFIIALIVLFSINSQTNYNKDLSTKIEESNEMIAIYVNDIEASSFPNSNNYYVNLECQDKEGNTVYVGNNIIWNSTLNKWEISLTNISNGSTRCNVYFTEKSTWNNPANNTLLYAIKNDPLNTVQALPEGVTPGITVSTSEDAFMSSALDDYGTSYYFRGAVQNNYVKFANMCWRIVRVTGNGDIKLVLYNNSSNNCSTSSSNQAFARVLGSNNGQLNWNYVLNNNAYIGVLYGDTTSSLYSEIHANTNPSNLFLGIMQWYDDKFNTKQQRLIADTIWCNDKKYQTVGNGIGTTRTNYSAYYRIGTSSMSGASLICNNDGNGGNLSKLTARAENGGNGALTYNNKEYKTGLLTIDEVGFAGANVTDTNNSYYLYANATVSDWWSLSPYYYNGGARIYCAGSTGKMTTYNATTGGRYRPAIALISSVKITGGNGQKSTPYIIDES